MSQGMLIVLTEQGAPHKIHDVEERTRIHPLMQGGKGRTLQKTRRTKRIKAERSHTKHSLNTAIRLIKNSFSFS